MHQQQQQQQNLDELLPPISSEQQRIYLIRHGETDWNAKGMMQGGGYDIELNEQGKQQATKVANVLSNVPFGVIVSSHLLRAKVTADTIYNACTDKPQDNTKKIHRLILKGLGEMRFGEYEGVALRGPNCTKEINDGFQSINEQMKRGNIHLQWPNGGESLKDVEIRAREALHIILNDYTDCTYICIVAHGRVNNILLASLLEDNNNNIQNFYKYHQTNCCINVIDYNKQQKTFIKRILQYEEHMKE